jgi:hypothetical protein
MRGVLNSGHTRDAAFVIRCDGEDNEPRKFSTWAAKAITSIGKLAETLRDRSIILATQRKKPSERVIKLRARETEDFVVLRRKAARWADDHIEALRDARPDIPEQLNDRAQDNWEPLLAIADLAGPDWSKVARVAAVALSGDADADVATTNVELVVDIKSVLAAHKFMTTKSLIAGLAQDETKRWGGYSRDGRPITDRQLARLLKDFGIRPRDGRIGGVTGLKGYYREDFLDSWERYSPSSSPEGGSPSATVRQVNDINDLDEKSSATPDFLVADKNGPNPLKTNNCSTVADKTTPSGEIEGAEATEEPQAEPEEPHACAQCHRPPDGKEQRCSIAGVELWLHPECQRAYQEGSP